MLALFLKGLAVGFAIAAPVGPVGLLCIRRSLAEGALAGFAVGLGAAAADAVYGAIAGFGLSAVADFLVGWQSELSVVGGALLLVFGWRILRTPAGSQAAHVASGLWPAFLGTFAITLTNPATILSFVAIYAGLGLAVGLDWQGAAVFVAGVFLGSAAWWAILARSAGAFRGRTTPEVMVWVNRASGALVMTIGLVAIALSFRA